MDGNSNGVLFFFFSRIFFQGEMRRKEIVSVNTSRETRPTIRKFGILRVFLVFAFDENGTHFAEQTKKRREEKKKSYFFVSEADFGGDGRVARSRKMRVEGGRNECDFG